MCDSQTWLRLIFYYSPLMDREQKARLKWVNYKCETPIRLIAPLFLRESQKLLGVTPLM